MTSEFSEIGQVRGICRESFFDFVQEFWHTCVAEPLVLNWHIKYLCDELQIMAERVFKNETREYDLLINVSPGSSKSTLISQLFPAWTWTRMPSCRHICGSYAYSLALKDSIACRDIVKSELYQACYKINLREDQDAKGLFVNTKRGYRLSAAVRGQLTGYHGHFLLVDDPLNPEESFSEADLKKVNRWMTNTLPTRRINKMVTPMILVQQRLHEGDPTGQRLEKSPGSCKHICIPAELTEGCKISPPELKRFYINGLMDPERLPREALDEQRKELGEYGFSAQYLQNPVPLGGGMFKIVKLHIHDGDPPRFLRICRSWDKAGTPDGGNWTAGVLGGMDKNDEFWVVDVQRGQWGATDRESMIKQTAQLDSTGKLARLVSSIQSVKKIGLLHPSMPGGEFHMVETIVEKEGGSGGMESAEATVRNLGGYFIYAYHPTGDKASRAYPLASQVGIKNNVHVLKREWTQAYISELGAFPFGRYDDQVDASSGCFNWLKRKPRRAGGLSFIGV